MTRPARVFPCFFLARRAEPHRDILFPRQGKVLSYRNTEKLTVEVQCFSLRKVAVMASQQRESEEPFVVMIGEPGGHNAKHGTDCTTDHSAEREGSLPTLRERSAARMLVRDDES